MNTNHTSTDLRPAISCADPLDLQTMRQFQLAHYWQSQGGDPNVFSRFLPLFDVVESSTDGAIAREAFEARLEELEVLGIGQHLTSQYASQLPLVQPREAV